MPKTEARHVAESQSKPGQLGSRKGLDAGNSAVMQLLSDPAIQGLMGDPAALQLIMNPLTTKLIASGGQPELTAIPIDFHRVRTAKKAGAKYCS